MRPLPEQTTRSMMPGFERNSAQQMQPSEMLRFTMMQKALRRLQLPFYTADARFITENANVHPALLSERQAANFNRLGWKHRQRLPHGVAPASDPGNGDIDHGDH
jgi:hypothetical protein